LRTMCGLRRCHEWRWTWRTWATLWRSYDLWSLGWFVFWICFNW
jgi:hypothetical protein